jgi:hypothetical protein
MCKACVAALLHDRCDTVISKQADRQKESKVGFHDVPKLGIDHSKYLQLGPQVNRHELRGHVLLL